ERLGSRGGAVGSRGRVGGGNGAEEGPHNQQGGRGPRSHPDARLIHAGRPSRPNRDRVFPGARGSVLQVKIDGLLAAISRWNCGIVAHDQLPAQGLATQLTAVILGKRCLKGCDSFRRDASQTLFEAADGRDLRHNGAEPPIGSTENNSVTAGIAGSPDANMSRIDFRLVLKKRNRAPPIGDLLPRVDISALRAITRSEIPMVMNEHDETGLCEGPHEWLEAVL